MKAKEYVFDASYQPQVRSKRGTQNIMLDVIIALIPALLVGIWQFGISALLLTIVSVLACVVFEYAYRKLMKKNNMIDDLSAVVTGMLIAFVVPSTTPWWVVVIADFFAIVVVKQLYGGLGKNFLNPALAGRAFVFFSYTSILSNWEIPSSLANTDLGTAAVDGITMATPLTFLKSGNAMPDALNLWHSFIGMVPGCIGEISVIALLIGGAYLICRKVITWHIPVSFIATVAVICLIFGHEGYTRVSYMMYNLFSGGLMLGAIFMATDYATSPVTPKGRIIYGIGCGCLTMLIRAFGGFPEGVSFAILIMNCFAWMIDKATPQIQFGETKEDIKNAKQAAKAAAKEGA